MLVVIIDDNATNLKVYVNVVSHIAGVETRTFQSSSEGLAWCKETEPDLLVLDYHMPTPNGIEFIQEYRRMRPTAQTPIIMITGEQDRELRRTALDIGASDFVSKPADPVEFLARVRNLLTAVESRRLLEKKSLVVADASASALHQAAAHDVETINLLMRAVEYVDNPSGMHVVRIGQYAALLARGIGRPLDEQRQIMLAAPLHDAGKCAVRDTVLLKNGPLTPAEWEEVRRHPDVGYEILKRATVPRIEARRRDRARPSRALEWRRLSEGLAGTAIPLAARIVAVADAFDAMFTDRPYRGALAARESLRRTADARRYLLRSGHHGRCRSESRRDARDCQHLRRQHRRRMTAVPDHRLRPARTRLHGQTRDGARISRRAHRRGNPDPGRRSGVDCGRRCRRRSRGRPRRERDGRQYRRRAPADAALLLERACDAASGGDVLTGHLTAAVTALAELRVARDAQS